MFCLYFGHGEKRLSLGWGRARLFSGGGGGGGGGRWVGGGGGGGGRGGGTMKAWGSPSYIV